MHASHSQAPAVRRKEPGRTWPGSLRPKCSAARGVCVAVFPGSFGRAGRRAEHHDALTLAHGHPAPAREDDVLAERCLGGSSGTICETSQLPENPSRKDSSSGVGDRNRSGCRYRTHVNRAKDQ